MTETSREPVLRVVPGPTDINANGHIFGGWVLSQMDIAGGIVASATMDLLGVDRLELCPWALREGIILRRLDGMH